LILETAVYHVTGNNPSVSPEGGPMPTVPYRDLAKIIARIQAGKAAPVYLIAGDPFLAGQVHQQLLEALLPEALRALNWEQVDGEKEEIPALIERLRTYPFFPGRKVLSVKNPGILKPAEPEDLLWSRAEEAWEKKRPERCLQILSRLQPKSRQPASAGDLQGLTSLFKKARPTSPGETLVGWLDQALAYWTRHPMDWFNPETLLEQALTVGFPEGHVLILLTEGLASSKAIVKTITQQGILIDLTLKKAKKAEQTATARRYLQDRLAREGKRMGMEAEVLLLERVGPELGLLEMEIQKLVNFSEEGVIPLEAIEALVAANRDEPIYDLTAALGRKNPLEGLRIFRRLGEQGVHPLPILAGLINAFRRFLLARERLAPLGSQATHHLEDYLPFTQKVLPRLSKEPLPESLSKLHPFALFNTFRGAQNFTLSELVRSLESLQRIDRQLKTGGGTDRFLLEDFILTFGR
jgi:DNA polymerase III subunit delta